MTKRKIPFDILDSIRGIASLYVVIAHCRGALWVGGNEFSRMFPRAEWGVGDYLMIGSSMLTRLAVEFVIVFFVLSGFSIAHSLSADKSALSFYKRRFVRIYPSYFVALAWAGAVFLLTRLRFPQWYDGSLTTFSFIRTVEMNTFFDPKVLLHNLFYMPGKGFITPFWSLTYEVIFYLLAPFLLRRVKIYYVVSIILFAINLLFPHQVTQLHLPGYIRLFLFDFNIYFVVGIFLYNYYDVFVRIFSTVPKQIRYLLLFFNLALMYATNFYFGGETTYNFIVAAIMGVQLILFFVEYKVKIGWLMKVGQFSYTLYITHFSTIYLYLSIYWLLFHPTTPYILSYFVWMPAIFFCLGIAFIQYMLVENKTKSILNGLRNKKINKAGQRVT